MKQGVATFQQRKDTFLRRGRYRWPYIKYSAYLAQPETLASAGFVFTPAKDAPDNVQCFHCGFELTGWEPDDDPFAEHHAHQPGCAYARLHCQVRTARTGGKVEWTGWPTESWADPAADASAAEWQKVAELRDDVDVRRATFEAGGWPHAGRADWHVTPEKLARAGFYYTPEWPGDDTATCAFCGYALAEWEPDDDPNSEHARRSAECLFFRLDGIRLGSAGGEAAAAQASEAGKRRSGSVGVVIGGPADGHNDGHSHDDDHSDGGESVASSKRQRLSMADRTEQGADASDSADDAGGPVSAEVSDASDADGHEERATSDGHGHGRPAPPIDSDDTGLSEDSAHMRDSPDRDTQMSDTQADEAPAPASPGAMVVDEAHAGSGDHGTQQSTQVEVAVADGDGEWELAEDEEDLTVEEFIRACCEHKIAALEASASQMIDAFMKRAEDTREHISSMTW
ncbi:hypothetical protein LPJ61_000401 [Coemansia biformis]|uniref:BIR-domain-containing protein n=1 Tax=Coemansia biformis TaxID=1286918 RepID=A0A9W8D0K4_9FUNG|nr:hypothetical protein LPJ61_000401 [Coemansia biformis]